MNKKWIVTGILCSIFLIGYIVIGLAMKNVESPKYIVISSFKNIEVRKYAPMIIAEVEAQGDREQAIKNGFRLLADYIFGNNMVQKNISMTSTVTQQSNSEKIEMTAPVIQSGNNKEWVVRFVMPSNYTMETLPKPNREEVQTKKIPEKLYAVIRFSGMISEANLEKNTTKLRDFLAKNQMKYSSDPIYAFYNPPWTLPFFRRNEVMIQLEN